MRVLKTAGTALVVGAWMAALTIGGVAYLCVSADAEGRHLDRAALATARKRLGDLHRDHALALSRMETAERRGWIARGLEVDYIRRIKEAESALADAEAAAAADKAMAEAEKARLQQTLEAVKAAIAADVLTSR